MTVWIVREGEGRMRLECRPLTCHCWAVEGQRARAICPMLRLVWPLTPPLRHSLPFSGVLSVCVLRECLDIYNEIVCSISGGGGSIQVCLMRNGPTESSAAVSRSVVFYAAEGCVIRQIELSLVHIFETRERESCLLLSSSFVALADSLTLWTVSIGPSAHASRHHATFSLPNYLSLASHPPSPREYRHTEKKHNLGKW